MKIESVTPFTAEIVEIDGLEWTTYQRSAGGTWLVLMGESWESCYSSEGELESAYQAYKAGLNG